jgi:adenylate cyclase, class 2
VIEAELKARLSSPDAVRARLGRYAAVERAIYRDTYYDAPGEVLERDGRELRLRTVETPNLVRHLLTYKEAAVDRASGSKPEYETTVATPSAVAHLLEGLGYPPSIELTKDCENYRLSRDGREFLATVVRVPEVEGTYLEVETLAEESDVDAALSAVWSLMQELGVTGQELTTELYTDAVRKARQG